MGDTCLTTVLAAGLLLLLPTLGFCRGSMYWAAEPPEDDWQTNLSSIHTVQRGTKLLQSQNKHDLCGPPALAQTCSLADIGRSGQVRLACALDLQDLAGICTVARLPDGVGLARGAPSRHRYMHSCAI